MNFVSVKLNKLLIFLESMDRNFTQNYRELLKQFKGFFENRYRKGVNSQAQLESDLAKYINKYLENQECWRVVNNITQQINSTMDIKSLYRIIIEQLLTILDINFCAICTYDELSKQLVLNHSDGCLSDGCKNNLEILLAKCNEYCKEGETSGLTEIISSSMKYNSYSVPLINKGKFLGTILVCNMESPINDESIQILTLVADNIAFAIMNAQLYSILEQKDQDKLEFIASMSHDLKNPLNSIIGFTNLLREGAIDDKETTMKYLNRISISSLHMSNLVADIMDMARAESGKIELAYEMFSPKMVILEILSTQESELSDKHINLKTSLNDFPISADSKRFRQVIYNLVSNAAKFTDEDGLIEITTHCRDEKFYFEIKDNGEGISPEHQGKLFKFFSQANDSLAKRREGYGIGLAVCKKVIDLHKGEINFESEKGKGTTFWFTLPVEMPTEIKTTAENVTN